MSWHDRWTGQPAAAPPPRVIPGRWMLTEGTATWGDVPLVPGDRLTPLGDETWHLQAADADTHEGTFTTPDGLAPLVGDSLREIAAALGDGFDPDHITAVSPLVPELDRRVRVTALTGQLEAELHHVLDIARAPHLRLRVDAERVPLDRVKRPDRRAPLTLASRADDWEAPTLTGVRPRRLLARLTEDEIDFYENRAAARLIDHLLRWLTERLAEIDALVGLLESMADFSDRLDGIDHRRRYRLTSLWGEGYAQHETLAVARETKRRIATLRRQLQGTLTSRLYRAVPSRAQIGDTLRQTNLLQNDQRYRFVARLWQAWLAERHKPEADPRRRHALAQQRARDVDAFARLVVMRALTDLGVTLRRKGGGYTLRWHDTEAHLTLATDGTLTLDGPHHPSWRLVPLPWAPSARPGRLATIAAELAPSVPPRGVSAARTIGLCVDVDPPAEGLLTHAFDPSPTPALTIIPISPLCLESVERLRHALRWWLHAPRLATWPLRATLPAALRDVVVTNTPWLTASPDKRQPDDVILTDWPRPIPHPTLDALAEGIDRFRRRPDERAASVTEATTALADLTRRAHTLARCPECSQPAPRPDRVDARALAFTCRACTTGWRLDACARCRAMIPVIADGEPSESRCAVCPSEGTATAKAGAKPARSQTGASAAPR